MPEVPEVGKLIEITLLQISKTLTEVRHQFDETPDDGFIGENIQVDVEFDLAIEATKKRELQGFAEIGWMKLFKARLAGVISRTDRSQNRIVFNIPLTIKKPKTEASYTMFTTKMDEVLSANTFTVVTSSSTAALPPNTVFTNKEK